MTVPLHRGAGHRKSPAFGFVLALIGIASILAFPLSAAGQSSYVTSTDASERFPLSEEGTPAPLYVSSEDHDGVQRAVRDVQTDLGRVAGTAPSLSTDEVPSTDPVVLVGTIGNSPVIDRLVDRQKLNVAGVAGRWETFLLQVVDDPLPNVDRALVIAGSDKRGTIYGLYDLVEEIGVSPWHWWADVPVAQQSNLYVLPDRHTEGPAVKYRGIFLNDENPALLGWVNETFGGFNHEFYTRVYELILRLKGNYLWPAMWGKSLFDDDSLSYPLADEYGIVMGTTHHEPMMRSHVEWERYGTGPWNYRENADSLRQFWRTGIERMNGYESIVSVGMRGDGDEPMTDSTAIDLLETIVADQRDILEDVTGKEASEVPQVWALYKEVQEYYDRGMEVPEDITLLFADDNWGNIRRLPSLDSTREGGYGVYYHFDYVGGPNSYKWINTTQNERVWEQMHTAHRYGANRLWIANVGDLKPMEFPISFFLDYAWSPDEWTAEDLPDYSRQWARQQFGEEHAPEIADLMDTYTKYNSRRTPEMLSPDTYSLTHYREAERVVSSYNALAEKAQRIYNELPQEYRAAYDQLVLYPVAASANLNDLYVTTARNRLYAEQGRAATNALADTVEALFEYDQELTRRYHEDVADGKWTKMMSQAHIGDTGDWRAPSENKMPSVETIDLTSSAEMGVAVEGSKKWWPHADTTAALPPLHEHGRHTRTIDVFNRGRQPFEYTAESDAPWLQVHPASGRVDTQQELQVEVDWTEAPTGRRQIPITISGPNETSVTVQAEVVVPADTEHIEGFVESNGYVSMDAVHYTEAVSVPPVEWQNIPNLGRTGSAMTTLPATAPSVEPTQESSHLAYKVHLSDADSIAIHAHLSPTLDYRNRGGFRYGISVDDGPIQIVNMHAKRSQAAWQRWVGTGVNVKTSHHAVDGAGEHTVRFWRVDPGVVLQKLVIDAGGLQPSYLGPPESQYRPANP